MAAKRSTAAAAVLLVAAMTGAACSTPAAVTGPPTVTVTAPPAAPATVTAGPTTSSPSAIAQPSTTVSRGDSDTVSWAEVIATARPAVVRLDVASCTARWMGSGFVVGQDLVMTANHVVDGASAISVQHDNGVTTAKVVGVDPATDSALIRTDAAITDRPLRFRQEMPSIGSTIAVLGYPLRTYELRFTKGSVSGLREPIRFQKVRTDALVTDAVINPGNSGGPVLDTNGRVVGLVSAQRLAVSGAPDARPVFGQGYVIRADDLGPNLARWRGQPSRGLATCGPADSGRDQRMPVVALDIPSRHVLAPDVARSLLVHGQAINLGNYQAAWQVFTPTMRAAMGSLDAWSRGLARSLWTALVIERVSADGRTAMVDVRLTTTQDAAHGVRGQTCSRWQLRYAMVNAAGGWLIDKAVNAAGSPVRC